MILVGEIEGGRSIHYVIPRSRPTVIGRGDDTELQLDVHGISRHHTQIDFVSGQWIVRDLESTNGTFVNGQKVKTCALRAGDILQFGDVTLRLLESKSDNPSPPKPPEEEKRPLPKLSPKETRAPAARRPGCLARIRKWCFRALWWGLFLYAAFSYYTYMTTMNRAIDRRNEGVDMVDAGQYEQAVTAYEEAREIEQEAMDSLFVKVAYPVLPKKKLSIDEDIADAWHKQGNAFYNNTEANMAVEALEAYQKAFELNPDIRGLAKRLAQLAFLQAKWQTALNAADKALETAPHDEMLIKIKYSAERELNTNRKGNI